jgi:hypothetical protein
VRHYGQSSTHTVKAAVEITLDMTYTYDNGIREENIKLVNVLIVNQEGCTCFRDEMRRLVVVVVVDNP